MNRSDNGKILRQLLERHGSMAVAELAAKAGMPKSQVYDALKYSIKSGVVVKRKEPGEYIRFELAQRSNADTLRNALATFGPQTRLELAERTGVPADVIRSALRHDMDTGRVVKRQEAGSGRNLYHLLTAEERHAQSPASSGPVRLEYRKPYWKLAELARRLERERQFEDAAEVWESAGKHVSPESEFCKCRAAFCRSALRNGYGKNQQQTVSGGEHAA